MTSRDSHDPSTDETSTHETSKAETSLGHFIRAQRELAELPMRQLAAMVGISNPYLSQIENGLRSPSEQVLSALADSLQISVDALREVEPDPSDESESPVLKAISEDPDLTAAQRRALEESYSAFRQVTISRRRPGTRRRGSR